MLKARFSASIVRYKLFFIRLCTLLLSCLVGVWGFPLLLNTPAHQHVAITIADEFTGSRDWNIEQTTQQLSFRWVPSDVFIPIPLWSPFMLLHTNTWIHPDADTATLQVGRVHALLAHTDFQSPRTIQLLVAPEATTRIDMSVHVTKGTAQWAFTDVQLEPTQPTRILTPIWVLWLLAWASTTVVFIRWRPSSWHWGVLGTTVMTTVALTQLAPIGTTIHNLLQISSPAWIVAGVIFIGIICWWAPQYLHWMQQAARVPRFVIGVYTLITIVPLGFTFFHTEFELWPIAENRRLAPWPQWQDPIQYSAAAEAWLMDHIGLRALMIRSKNELDYRLLQSSRRVYFGKDDHLFLRRWNDERLPALLHILQDRQKRTALAQQITEQVAWYEAQGLTCYVVIAPSKEFIYPEYLPWYVTPTSYQHIVDFENELRAQGVTVVPTYDILQHIKPQVPQLYYPQDFHWNRISAYYVGQYILTDLQQHQPANNIELPHILINEGPTPVHDRTFAALLSDHLSYPPSYEGRIDIAIERSKITNPGGNLITYPADMPVLYPQQSLLIVGDSFSARLHDAGFAGGFSTIYRTGRPRDRTTFATWIASTNITTVVWQLRDMSLPLYLADQEEE